VKTLTITDAKRNLGRWLTAAARGEDIGIISGADIIALRKVKVESTDYALREYGATQEEVQQIDDAAEQRYQKLKKEGQLRLLTPAKLKKMLEEATRH
jgi:antitoxin (DNA-binding transcriptional repressor) of toxin-antitoxin stability system